MPSCFSDRHRAPRPRTDEAINESVWGEIFAIVSGRLSDGSLGYKFPETCPDGYGVIGHDGQRRKTIIKAYRKALLPMYDAVADNYCYPGTTVLKNKLDLRDAGELADLKRKSAIQGPTKKPWMAVWISRTLKAIHHRTSCGKLVCPA